jgi:hypothetical protein
MEERVINLTAQIVSARVVNNDVALQQLPANVRERRPVQPVAKFGALKGGTVGGSLLAGPDITLRLRWISGRREAELGELCCRDTVIVRGFRT